MQTLDDNTQQPPQLDGHYKVVGVKPGRVVLGAGQGEVDLRTISLERAHELAKNGFPYLEAVAGPHDREASPPPEKPLPAEAKTPKKGS